MTICVETTPVAFAAGATSDLWSPPLAMQIGGRGDEKSHTDRGYYPSMAKLTDDQIKTILDDVEGRLVAGKYFTNHEIEAPFRAAGFGFKAAQKLIRRHGSVFLLSKYVESFGAHVPAELKTCRSERRKP